LASVVVSAGLNDNSRARLVLFLENNSSSILLNIYKKRVCRKSIPFLFYLFLARMMLTIQFINKNRSAAKGTINSNTNKILSFITPQQYGAWNQYNTIIITNIIVIITAPIILYFPFQ
jgi:hypothetical protein